VAVRGRGQEPPDVTCGEPELADGADEPCRPLRELDDPAELELDELDLDEPELLDVPALELAEPEPEVVRLAAAVCADPGRV
jgi:hypothetical protein